MTYKLLISGIPLPRKQASSIHEKLFSSGLPTFQLFMTFVCTLVILIPHFLAAQTRDDSLQAYVPVNSYIVKETGSSAILMAKDIDRPVSPASLTKILTCIMAIESGRLEEDVVITKESTMVEPSKAGFKPGDRIKLIDLVKAAMVNSSNDAAFAIAIYLSGTVDSFVAAMNYRAQRIGMKNSRFTNPAGFDKDIYAGNISTAGDLLRLTEYAIRNPVFNLVARLDRAVFIEQTSRKLYSLKTHNKLLDKYPYAVGIKTGYTTKAGRCLIARAVKDNKDILLVMLNAKTDRWNVAADMFDSAFSSNRSNPYWFAQPSRVVASSVRIPAVAFSGKSDKKEVRLSRHRHQSKKQVIARLKSNRTSKQHAIAGQKISRKSKHHAIAESRVRRKSKHQAISELKSGNKSVKQAIVRLKSGNKLKKREIVSSKPARKIKKKATVS
ncbi:MAG: D-alanyl-D-alanine carboxypeptidase [Chlorobiaceae bacterium]|jgi:serine-type D-Ala-D-Ala carboxypeptidase (penicillin-binding protein 5/6)|nr:D-alanyl-D-alanine carboxypeptidase [Chlorobiaceae bacterium]NTV17259.1 D-alanyl-D-alanine carboxypeptidase [Chlorobiaceae bacterium]